MFIQGATFIPDSRVSTKCNHWFLGRKAKKKYIYRAKMGIEYCLKSYISDISILLT